MMASSLFRRKSEAQALFDSEHNLGDGPKLQRTLTARDLTALGIAAIIGAGIFSTIGNAAAAGGPAIALLFVFTAIACAFSALCYAEFASRVPVAGSAYTYAYFSFGEIIAWIVGWDLLLEYAVGNIAVAISWSDYASGFLSNLGLGLPSWLTVDYFSAKNAFNNLGTPDALINKVSPDIIEAWQKAPRIGGIPFIIDLPALLIVFFVTALVYRGIKESKRVNNFLVALKLIVVLMVIGIGAFYINPDNWTPFAPTKITGVLKGISAIFFAYIGFDAISTTAEETKNPQRDMPRAILASLAICTVLYVLIALTLTGVVHYSELAVGDPLAFVFGRVGLPVMEIIVAASAVVAMTGVLLVFQLGQPRILMSMSRDGLLPPAFKKIHPRFGTPWIATIVTGFLVAIPTAFTNLQDITDLTVIGTLFAFILVCGGILIKPSPRDAKGFKVPYVNSRIPLTILLVGIVGAYYLIDVDDFGKQLGFSPGLKVYENALAWFFTLCTFAIWVLSLFRKLSLIPVLGIISCLYLMTQLPPANWTRFLVWLLIGLVVYALYGYRKSVLAVRS